MSLEHTRHWKLNVTMMVLSQILVMAGFCAAMPFVPLYLKEGLGILNDGDRGLYLSLFNFFGTFAYGIFNPIWGTLSDRFGVKPMLLRGTFLTAFFFPMMAYVTNVWMLIALRFITAACAGTTVAAQTLLVKNTPENKQGLALGMLTTAYWSGLMLGNVLGGLVVSYYGYKNTFWFCGILYFAAGVFVLFAKDDYIPAREVSRTAKSEKKHRPGRSLLPSFTVGVWLLMLLTVCCGLAFSFSSPYAPMLIEQVVGIKKAAFWTGITSAVAAVGSIVSGLLTGYLADRIPPLKILIPIYILTAFFMLLLGLTPILFADPEIQLSFWGKVCTLDLNLLVLAVCRVMILLVVGGSGAVFMKMMSNATPKRKRGSVFGYRSTAHQIGCMLASCFAGWLVYVDGNVRSVYYCAALLIFLLFPLTVWIVRRIEKDPFYASRSCFKERTEK